jgi:signal transduction histidine kinase
MRRLRAHLRSKFLLAFALILIPVLALLWVDFRASLVRQEDNILRNHMLTAQAVALQVDEAFDDLIGLGWAVAHDRLARGGDRAQVDELLQGLVQHIPQIASIAVHDARGATRGWAGAATTPDDTNVRRLDMAGRPEFLQVMATNLPQLSDVLPTERTGVPGLVAVVPIRDADERPVGVVVVGTSTDQLARRYEQARLLPGQAIFLADRGGRLAFHTGHSRMTSQQSMALVRSEPLRAALAGIPTTRTRFVSPEGRTSLAAFVPTMKYRWGVGLTVPRSIALAPVRRGFLRELFAFAGILLVSLMLAVLFARLLVDPVRRLEAAATALGRGDLSSRVHIERTDEIGRLGTAFDTMAAQLTALHDEQRRLLQAREDFLQAAAHELKTPIAAIMSSVHLLLGTSQDSQSRRTLEIARRGARRMALLVEDLLAVARLGAEFPQPHKETVDLEGVIGEAARRLTEATETHPIERTVRGPLMVEADRELISLVLIQLLENAVAASPAGAPIELSASREDGEAVVSVADHGAGVPLESRAHLFDPFYEPVPSGRPGYTGVVSLRLHLCNRILAAHGGRIGLRGTVPEGSTFFFALPLARA